MYAATETDVPRPPPPLRPTGPRRNNQYLFVDCLDFSHTINKRGYMESGNISIVRGNKHTPEKFFSAERWECFLFTAKRKTKRGKVLREMRRTDRMLARRNRRETLLYKSLRCHNGERNYLFIYMCSWEHAFESGIVRYYSLTLEGFA